MDNSNAPFLTYGAGGTTDSRITNTPYLFTKQQNPVELQSSGYISGNLKKYAQNPKNSQKLLKKGFDSKWSINAQGINNFGSNSDTDMNITTNNNAKSSMKNQVDIPFLSPPYYPVNRSNPYVMAPTAFDRDQGNFAVSQYFRRDMFPFNGNSYGKSKQNKFKTKESKSKNLKSKENLSKKYVSPLGIEITF